MIENTANYVDKIYLSHSDIPWRNARTGVRESIVSDFDEAIIARSTHRDRITLISGRWDSEEEQRQEALLCAKRDGIDYLIIQDADEFYLPEEFKRNLDGIRRNPNHPTYTCPWVVFWKSLDYVVELRQIGPGVGGIINTCPNFAVNTRWPDISFSKARLVNFSNNAFRLPGLCLHLAWVLSDDEVLSKVKTWAHSHQFNADKWYFHKWRAWQPQMKNIGHITRYNYRQAVRFECDLPKELEGLENPEQKFRALTLTERFDSFLLDNISMLRVNASRLKWLLIEQLR
jgi:hypothetical protein